MENFVVSARKYRPATFESVVGQKHITSTLKNAIERGQLAHAYLFCGPRGVGKTTCARIFAKAINCLDPNGSEACNACESCRSFNENCSLNIHELDAASNNSVDDIRSLIEQVRIIPQVGRYSVFIIDEVHMLSQAAFNAFLKTLEEPPAHAIFILATTEKHKIIPTILSRCQIYDFNRIRMEDGVEYLRYIAAQEGVTADDESLNLIAQKADGGMRDALSMFDKAVSFCGNELRYREVAQTLNVLDYDTYFRVTEQLLNGNYIDVLLTFDEVITKGFSGQTFLSGLNRHMRDLLVARDPASLRLIEITGSLLERYRTQAAGCNVEFLFGAIDLLSEMDGKIRQSSNQRLLVELGLMKIAGLGQKKKGDGVAIAEPSYPLPELTQQRSQVAEQPPLRAPIASIPTTPAVEQSRPAPQAAASPEKEVPNPIQPKEQPLQEEKRTTPTELPTAPSTLRSKANRSPLISLADLMGEKRIEQKNDEPIEQEPQEEAAWVEQQLTACQNRLIEGIREMRPRFAAAFEQMHIQGNRISVTVPTRELEEEILRTRTELLMRCKELANIRGGLELEVIVNEELKASLPIRLEDRQAWLMERNPHLASLKRLLGLEAES